MAAAADFTLASKVSACLTCSLINAISSAKSRKVIHTGFILRFCRRLIWNPSSYSFPFIAMILKSSAMIKKYGARVSPYNTPARITNNSVLPSGERAFAVVFVHITSIALTSLPGMPYARSILIKLPMMYGIKCLFVNSMKIMMAERFTSLLPSINRRRANIVLVVLPVVNPFWFILR